MAGARAIRFGSPNLGGDSLSQFADSLGLVENSTKLILENYIAQTCTAFGQGRFSILVPEEIGIR